MTDPNEVISTALEHHQAGNLNKASDLYNKVLREDPLHTDALHLMGLVHQQKKDPVQAIEYIQKAIEQNGEASLFHSNLGNVYREVNEIDKAMNSFRAAIQIEPGFAGAHYNLAMAYEAMGETDEAISCYEDAIKNNPNFVEAVNNLGNLYNSLENYDRATRCYEHAISLIPNSAHLHFNHANALASSGQLNEAVTSYLKAFDFDPNSSDILNNLGSTYKKLENFEQAEIYLKKAVECIEVNPEAYNNLGSLYMVQSNPEAGIELFKKAVEKSPGNLEYQLNLARAYKEIKQAQNAYDELELILKQNPDHQGACFQMGELLLAQGEVHNAIQYLEQSKSLGRHDHVLYNTLGTSYLKIKNEEVAEKCFNQAIEANPSHGIAYHNLGCLYLVQGSHEKALYYTQKALQINPDYQIALVNEGILHKELGNLKFARESFDHALKLKPDDSNVLLQYSLLDILEGNWEKGWENYQHRWSQIEESRNLPKQEWDGEDLSDKTILIHAEQGLGDEIMYASCISGIIAEANNCYLECNPRLVKIFRQTFPNATIIKHPVSTGSDSEQFWNEIDYILPIGSTAKHFRKKEADFPKDHSYLKVDPELCAYWKEKLNHLSGKLKVGISWNSVAQQKRMMSLEAWTSLLERDDISIVNLQYGKVKEDLDSLSPELAGKIHQFDEIDPLKELDHFAALIHELDLVISVDNSTVHFAGALGTKTWALLPKAPSWRWLLDRSDTVWYSTVELFRQTNHNDWSDIFREINNKLNTETGTDHSFKESSSGISDKPAVEMDHAMKSDSSEKDVIVPESVQEKSLPDDVLREKKKYEKMWKVEQYRRFSPGLEDSLKIDFLKEFKRMSVKTILDAGCGSGKLMQKVIMEYSDQFQIHGFDISDNCLDPFFDSIKNEVLSTGCLWNPDDMSEKYDGIICTDVLEHIPTHKIPAVLMNLKRSMKTVGFFSIALFDDHFGPNTLGEPLHLTVKKPNWWFAQISLTGMQIAGQRVERNQDGTDLWLHLYVIPPEKADLNS